VTGSGSDFAHQQAEDLVRRLGLAGVVLPDAELTQIAPDWFEEQ
jgi:hypothetical protein